MEEAAQAAGEEVSEAAKKGTAEAGVYLRENGGLTGVVEGAVAKGVGKVAEGVGYAGKGVSALYNAATGSRETEEKPETDENKEDEGLVDRVKGAFEDAGSRIAKGYEKSEIDPEEIGDKFEQGTHRVTGAVGYFFRKIGRGVKEAGRRI